MLIISRKASFPIKTNDRRLSLQISKATKQSIKIITTQLIFKISVLGCPTSGVSIQVRRKISPLLGWERPLPTLPNSGKSSLEWPIDVMIQLIARCIYMQLVMRSVENKKKVEEYSFLLWICDILHKGISSLKRQKCWTNPWREFNINILSYISLHVSDLNKKYPTIEIPKELLSKKKSLPRLPSLINLKFPMKNSITKTRETQGFQGPENPNILFPKINKSASLISN